MTEQLHLLYIMVLSLKNMIKEVLIPCELHDEELNQHKVVDNAKHVLKDHCYWPLVSDLNNVLSHPSIAFRFMGDNTLLAMWFDFLKVCNFSTNTPRPCYRLSSVLLKHSLTKNSSPQV